MGGLLEDIGRSRAFDSVNNLMGKAIDIRKMENQDANQTLGRAIDLEQLGIQKETAAREATKFDWAEKAQKEKDAIDNMPVSISSIMGADYSTDPAKKMQFDKMKEQGLVNEPAPGVFMTTAKNATALKEYAKTNLEWTKQVGETALVATNNKLMEIDNALLEETNPKKIEELNQQKTVLSKKLSVLAEAHKRIDMEHQNKLELAKEKTTGKLVPVRGADGVVSYERVADAVGKEVPQKPAQKYKNVPGVGLVDISGDQPKVAIPAPVFGTGVRGAGGKPTANIQNIEYLVGNGWTRKDAEDVVLHGKRMPRENFIANMTKSIYGNEFIDDADKAKKMEESIKFYDSAIPQGGGGAKKPAAAGKVLDQATATSILQEAGGDKNKAREIAKTRGYKF